jgi:hypothetical protein
MIPRILIFLSSIILFGCISKPQPSALNGGVFLTIETKSSERFDSKSNNLYFQPIGENRVITIDDLQLKNKFKIEFEKRGINFDGEINSKYELIKCKKIYTVFSFVIIQIAQKYVFQSG